MLRILSFNTALQDIRICGRSLYRPVGYVEERMAALPRALAASGADIILLQEFSHRRHQDQVYRGLQKSYPYISGRGRSGWKLRLDNELVILSRYPVSAGRLIRYRRAAAEELLFTRKGFFHCTVTLPGGHRIQIINFHTTAGGVHAHPEDDAMGTIRAAQIEQMLAYTDGLEQVILAGDLNAGPHTSRDNYRQIIDRGYLDLAADGGEEYTWDRDNPLVQNGSEHHLPSQRIDHIFIDAAPAQVLQPVSARVVFAERCVTTGVGEIPLSDHYGILAELRPVEV